MRFRREKGIVIPEESVSSRDKLQEEARRLKVKGLSRLRTKDALEKAIQQAKRASRAASLLPQRLQMPSKPKQFP